MQQHTQKKKMVIVGATSAMAEHCARLWVAQGASELLLVGRDAGRLEKVAADLRVRGPGCQVTVRAMPFDDVTAIEALAAESCQGTVPDVVLIAHGSMPPQSDCQGDLSQARDALLANGVSPVLFSEAFAGRMVQAGHGTLAVISSVAGERGRRSNYVYGAGKGLVTRYVEGLQHRFAGTAVKAVLVKPGPTRTPMTAHLSLPMAEVEDVARAIVAGVERGSPVVYTPTKWALIMWIICHLPRFVFNKMDI